MNTPKKEQLSWQNIRFIIELIFTAVFLFAAIIMGNGYAKFNENANLLQQILIQQKLNTDAIGDMKDKIKQLDGVDVKNTENINLNTGRIIRLESTVFRNRNLKNYVSNDEDK